MDEIEPLMSERSDDVPMRLAQLEHMQVAPLLDRTTVSGSVHPSPDGLFQVGPSKDH